MRLLFLTNYYPPSHFGGYEELCAEIAIGLDQRGHDIIVLTAHGGDKRVIGHEPRVRRILHPEVDAHPINTTISFFFGREERLGESLRSLQTVIKEFHPDLIMGWGMWNLPRALMAQAEAISQPVVYYVADYWPTLPNAWTLHWGSPARHGYARLPRKILGWIALRMLAQEPPLQKLKFEHVLCVSQAVRGRLIEFSPQFGRAQVVHNGIDIELFTRRQEPRHQPSSQLSLLYAGRLSPDKGVNTAIEALGLIKRECNARLTILGSGSQGYLAEIQNLARRLEVAERVDFRERITRDQMPQMLSRHDVLIVPSLWQEPLPRIVQEGMASGAIVLASRVGGMSEIIQDGINGLLFEPGNAAELARHIETVAMDLGLRRRLVEQGFRTVNEQFSISRMLNEFEAYMKSVVVRK